MEENRLLGFVPSFSLSEAVGPNLDQMLCSLDTGLGTAVTPRRI